MPCGFPEVLILSSFVVHRPSVCYFQYLESSGGYWYYGLAVLGYENTTRAVFTVITNEWEAGDV